MGRSVDSALAAPASGPPAHVAAWTVSHRAPRGLVPPEGVRLPRPPPAWRAGWTAMVARTIISGVTLSVTVVAVALALYLGATDSGSSAAATVHTAAAPQHREVPTADLALAPGPRFTAPVARRAATRARPVARGAAPVQHVAATAPATAADSVMAYATP